MMDTKASRIRRVMFATLDVLFCFGLMVAAVVSAYASRLFTDDIIFRIAIASCLCTVACGIGALLHRSNKAGLATALVTFVAIEPTGGRSLKEAHDLVRFGVPQLHEQRSMARRIGFWVAVSTALSTLCVLIAG